MHSDFSLKSRFLGPDQKKSRFLKYFFNSIRSGVIRTNTAILSTGGVLLYLPHHLDLASEDSVGHSTCMSVLARRRAIMGSIVQPKRSCLGLSSCCHVLVAVYAGASQGYMCWGFRCTPPAVAAPRQGR